MDITDQTTCRLHEKAFQSVDPNVLASGLMEEIQFFGDLFATYHIAVDSLPQADKSVEQLADRLAASVVLWAKEVAASDVHLEAMSQSYRLRVRVHGVLRNSRSFPPTVGVALLKALLRHAGLENAEFHIPREAAFPWPDATTCGSISVVPTFFGQKVVVRTPEAYAPLTASLSSLGVTDQQREALSQLFARDSGLTFVIGRGKTRLLKAMVAECAGRRGIRVVQRRHEFGDDAIDAKPGSPLNSVPLDPDADVLVLDYGLSPGDYGAAVEFARSSLVVLSLYDGSLNTTVWRMGESGVTTDELNDVFVTAIRCHVLPLLCPECRVHDLEPSEQQLEWIRRAEPAIGQVVGGPILLWRSEPVCQACRDYGVSGQTGLYDMVDLPDPTSADAQGRNGDGIVLRTTLNWVLEGRISIEATSRVWPY